MDEHSEPAVGVLLTIDGDGRDTVQDLRAHLAGDDPLRGRVDVHQSRPRPGSLGTSSDAVLILLVPGLATALVHGLKTWLQHRTCDIAVAVRRPDESGGSIVLGGVRNADAQDLIDRFERIVRGEAPDDGSAEAPPDGSPTP